MYSRCRHFWSRLSRFSGNFRAVPIVTVKHIPKKEFTAPYILSFSLFTWLGFDKKDKVSAEDELIHTIKHCILFIQREEFEKAEQLLHVALRQAQQIHHQLGITYIYDIMANLALQREHLDKAKQLFVAVTQRIMADGATEDDARVIHLSAKLARVSHLKKEYSTAQLGYEWCLEKLHKAVEQDPSEVNNKLLALTEDWYGRLFIDCNRCEDGINFMVKSLNRMKQVSDVEQEHLVIQLNDIGTVCDRLGKTDESIQYLTEAIELAKAVGMDEVGAMYVNLGRAYIKKQLLDTARKHCGYAWRLGVTTKNKEIKDEAEMCLQEIKNIS
ncbi:tetratricopeptide repeat domain 19 [Anticarsia gemmatalis]|uniref:tetratricopeptide repeat domain 19 n=1 Tax=Anticarsia gemmatalis TaxID=129554 RepID=UPI003F772BA7